MNREAAQRTRMLLGDRALERLRDARIMIFGLGGVGSYAAEALARTGVGHFRLVDSDTVAVSNLNRQLIATQATLGMQKTEAEAERIRSINPEADVEKYAVFYGPQTAPNIPWDDLEYVIDAVDTVTAKLLIIEEAKKRGIPVISSMGTGNKLDPSKLTVTDICRTKIDPLARVMRRELRKRGIRSLKVVYSEEEPIRPLFEPEDAGMRKIPPGSVAFVPGAAGLLLASTVVRDLVSDTHTPEREG